MKAGAMDVYCIEMNPESAVQLRAKGYSTVLTSNFLTTPPGSGYQRIVMNPPFTKNQDIKHVAHALTWLAPGGLLVAVMLGNTERPKLKEVLDGYDWDFIEVPAGAFKESGTNIKTAILTVQR
jgi:16S rRNA G1207 methylase RsmC